MGSSVAHPQSLLQVELEFGNVGFCGGRKTGVPGEKPSERDESQQQTQPTYGVNSGNRTRATLLKGMPSLLPQLSSTLLLHQQLWT